MNYSIKPTHIADIVPGDTIHHEGNLRTVCKANVKKGGLFGTTLFGDSYQSGYKLVNKVIIHHALPKLKDQ